MSTPSAVPVRQLVLVKLLGTFAAERAGGEVSLDELLTHARTGAFGIAVGLLGLLSIPFVGLSTPFGLAVALVAAQMLLGRAAPWLPRAVRRRTFSAASLGKVADQLARWTRWLERATAPRLPALVNGSGRVAAALGILFLGLGLALPLPIPGSNAIFYAPILVYAIGLLEGDGLVVLFAHLGTLAVGALGVASWQLVAKALDTVLHWLS